MPPRKTRSKKQKEEKAAEVQPPDQDDQVEEENAVIDTKEGVKPDEEDGGDAVDDKDDAANGEDEKEVPKGHKRKQSAGTNQGSNKAPKTEEAKSTETKASPSQVLKFLLSKEAPDLIRPDDEVQDIKERGTDIVTYSQLLSPFEELLCAVILSRPISHRLGLRSIRTMLNPPYSFRTPDAIKETGPEKVLQSLWDARTQHKDKTADEISLLADVISDNDWHNDLQKMREKAKETVEEERELLRSSIKGLGKTGLDIFYRRIQWTWEEAYPFIDQRTKASVLKLGMPGEPDELLKMIEEQWADLDLTNDGDHANDEQKRRAFVLLLERAVGSDLEGKTERVLKEAAEA